MTTTPEATTPEAVNVTTTAAGTATATIDREAIEAERAAAAEQELLAGKFKTPEDLAKAYKELEQKLGQQSQQPAEEATETTTEETTTEGDTPNEPEGAEAVYGKVVADALTAAEVDASAAAAEFEKDGTLSDETFEKFEKAGFPKSVVEAYLRGVSAPAEEAAGLAESQITAIKASVGGDEAFGKMQQFIQTQFTEAEKVAYNEAVGSGNFETALSAVNEAKARYAKEIGSEGKLLGGKVPTVDTGYADESEMMADMKKPEYKKSQAFRDQVAAKIQRSTFHVMR